MDWKNDGRGSWVSNEGYSIATITIRHGPFIETERILMSPQKSENGWRDEISRDGGKGSVERLKKKAEKHFSERNANESA